MNGNVEGSLKRLGQINSSLDSLARVEQGRYYYYCKDSGQFYWSGHGAVKLIDSYWGRGYLTSGLQSFCRFASGESYKKLSNGIQDVAGSVLSELQTLETIAFERGMIPLKRQSLLEGLATLHAKVENAAVGIKALMVTYKDQPVKKLEFQRRYKTFKNDLPASVQKLYDKIIERNEKDKFEEQQRIWKEERERRLAQESKRRKNIGTKFHKQLKAAKAQRMNAYLLKEKQTPDPRTGLTQENLEEISRFLTVYQHRLARVLENQIKKDKDNPFLYLRPESTGLPKKIQFWSDKVIIHLKDSSSIGLIGKGVYKKVTKSVEFKNGSVGKIYANGCSTVEYPGKRGQKQFYYDTVADNEFHFLTKYRKIRGIVKVKDISRYRSRKGKIRQAILMKYYNQGNLLDRIKAKDLCRDKKNWILLDILYGLVHIHKDNAINLDVKPENILLENTSKIGRKIGISAALCDFGFCCYNHKVKAAGSHYYMAPEVVTAMYRPTSEYVTKITDAADMWSLGCTFWLLYVGSYTPWMELVKDQRKMSKEVIELMNREDAIPEPKKETIEHLLWQMMRPSPKDRPTSLEALKQLKWLLQEVEVMQEIPV